MSWKSCWDEEFHAALKDAFDLASLEKMLYFKLGKNLHHIVDVRAPLNKILFDLIKLARSEYWLPDLLHAAIDTIPSNKTLADFAAKIKERRECSPSLNTSNQDIQNQIQWSNLPYIGGIVFAIFSLIFLYNIAIRLNTAPNLSTNTTVSSETSPKTSQSLIEETKAIQITPSIIASEIIDIVNTPITVPTSTKFIQTTNPPANPTITIEPTETIELQTVYSPTLKFFEGIPYVSVPQNTSNGDHLVEFWIGLYEITYEQYAAFLNSKNPSNNCRDGIFCIKTNIPNSKMFRSNSQWVVVSRYEKHPAVQVSWSGAIEFCEEAGGRLPSLYEWTKAAGWNPITGEVSTYAWGNNTPIGSIANYNQQHNGSLVVSSYPEGRSVVGAFNMSGNVWEYVSNTVGTNRIWKGGAWDSTPNQLMLNAELSKGQNDTGENIGFRCARSP